MDTYTRRFNDMHHAVQSVHGMFKEWDDDPGDGSPTLFQEHPVLLHRARLALHEWLANLSQHANFRGRRPSILITITSCNRTFTCSVRDNSAGFDLAGHRPDHEDIFAMHPERGMGLEMIRHCTTKRNYETIDAGFNLFTFTISATEHDG